MNMFDMTLYMYGKAKNLFIGNRSFRPRVVLALGCFSLGRFGMGQFGPGSFWPNSVGRFGLFFSQLSGLLQKVN